MNRKYLTGRRYEWKVRDEWRKKGYLVLRSAGSKGLFDLVAISPDLAKFRVSWDDRDVPQIVLIQCKTGKNRDRALKKLEPLKKQFDGLYSVRVELV